MEKAVSEVPGVSSCAVSLLTNSMSVEGTASSSEIISAVEKAGYGASRRENGVSKQNAPGDDALLRDTETPKLKQRLAASVIFLLMLMYITMGHNMWGWPLPAYFSHNHLGLALAQLLLAAVVMVINQKFFTSGFRSLISGAPNMDTLVALGSSVSFIWSTFVFFRLCGMAEAGADSASMMDIYHNQLYYESAAMIPALITVGKLLESISKGKTTSALKNLIRLSPKTAVVLRDDEETEVGIEEVRPGDIFVIRPGDSIPVDGIVLEGNSAIDESALTGESVPVDKSEGDRVSAATVNRSGYLKCQATRVGEDTTLSQIIRMVSDASATKAPIARIADRVSGIFVPCVIGIAVVVLIGWLIAGAGFSDSLERAICVLVISCPCALGLATPVAVMVGNGIGARSGILIKTGEALETVGKIDTVVLDKTGTVTEGTPKVTDILPAEGVTELELLEKACALEEKSEHPLAGAIVAEAKQRGIAAPEAADFKALPGNGVEAFLGGNRLRGGSRKYIGSLIHDESVFSVEDSFTLQGKTPLYFMENERLLGMIAVADVIKRTSPEAVRQLKNLGIKVVMLTGDNEKTARYIGDQADVTEVIANVLPDQKESVIRSLQSSGKVAMVGDGINDAPALTRADVGIAIGAGTDVAIDSAQIVLMNSDLSDVAASVRLGRGTVRNIHENLFWAFFYNLICIPLAAGLFAVKMSPMYGAAAMSLSSVTVCLNALRLNLLNIRNAAHDRPRRSGNKAASSSAGSGTAATSEQLPQESAAAKSPTETVTLNVEGMMCPHCEATVRKALEALDFVSEASADHVSGTVTVQLNGNPDMDIIRTAIEEKGYVFKGTGLNPASETVLHVEGMMCPHCEATVKKALEALDFVSEASADHISGTVTVRTNAAPDMDAMRNAIEEKGYQFKG